MSVSHIIDPANTDLQNVYCQDLDVAGDIVISGGFEIDGLLETKGGISASGTATLPAIAAVANVTTGILSTTATAQSAASFTGNNSSQILNVAQSGAGNAIAVSGGNLSISNGNLVVSKNNATNAVISLEAPNSNAAAINYTIGGVLCGTLAADVNGLSISGALLDPTFDINLVVAGANKVLNNSAYSYAASVYNNAPAPGASPLVANTRVAVLRYEGISSVAAGGEVSLIWTNSLADVGSITAVKVLFTNAATNSCLTFKNSIPASGSVELFFVNGGSAATGAATSLTILAELIF